MLVGLLWCFQSPQTVLRAEHWRGGRGYFGPRGLVSSSSWDVGQFLSDALVSKPLVLRTDGDLVSVFLIWCGAQRY